MSETRLQARTYRLTWEHGGVHILSEQRAAQVVGEWRRHGLVVGELPGPVRFESNFGDRARLDPTNGATHA